MKKIAFIILFLALQSCVLTDLKKGDEQITYRKILSDTSKSYLYKTEINLYDNYFSGIIVFKPKESGHRIVFMNEIGMKFFDIELLSDTFKLHQIFEPLNKKMFVKLLVNDFNLLLMNNLIKETEFYSGKKTELSVIKIKEKKELFYINNKNLPIKAIQYSVLRKHTFVDYENYKEEIPRSIIVHHKNIKFTMKMNLIQ